MKSSTGLAVKRAPTPTLILGATTRDVRTASRKKLFVTWGDVRRLQPRGEETREEIGTRNPEARS